ncbi:alpha-2-macroglobulin-like protein 1 isoform X2 [Neocloeon triangulifer]|uniref:alpha-2-macroglobulin-like protein 1 isoform X2 n=1 Tax=Neocloeon triangulifer TaxID=2078957 RepID=UPI00286F3ABC|nr:alpha-2-macroglobulin-like protein 1 isoform X2 [Neocloeon triangulifer]
MRRALLLLLCLLNFSRLQAENANIASKFIFVAPRTLSIGKNEKFGLNILENSQNLDFIIRLVDTRNDKELHQVSLRNAEAKMHSVDFPVPMNNLYSAELEVATSDGKTLKSQISFYRERNLVFVETDRPFYKPGELVRFRILHLKSKLLPVTEPITKVWIENPSYIKAAQWKKVKLNNGLAQLELQLTKEPIKGNWNIKVQTTNESNSLVSKSFEVKEYVLPKFEVTVEPPAYIVAQEDKNYTWKICGKYSFGGPVQGEAVVTFTIQQASYRWYNRFDGQGDTLLQIQGKLLRKEDGCVEFTLEKSQWKANENTHFGGISVKVTVEEKGTGEKQSTTHKTDFKYRSVTVAFDRSPSFYYPFIPYHGEVQFKYQDGEPISGKAVLLIANGGKAFEEQTIRAVTDQSGRVPFTLYPGKSNEEITIIGKFHPGTVESDATLKDVTGNHEITAWFSPSDSYISISAPKEVSCEGVVPAEITFTVPKYSYKTEIRFNYLVQSNGVVVKNGHQSVKVQGQPINPDSWPNIIYKANVTAEEQILTGKWTFNLNLEPQWSPQVKIVIFYLSDDDEIVASSKTFELKKCFQHKVTSKFVEKRAEPGQKVTLSLTTSSKSVCAISGIDKAVTFLDRERALTVDKVFNALKIHAVRPEYYNSWEYRTRKCEKRDDVPIDVPIPVPAPVKIKKRSIWRGFNYDITFGNSKRAFDEGGLLILSTLGHNIKPCQYGEFKENCDPCPYLQMVPLYSMRPVDMDNLEIMRGGVPEAVSAYASPGLAGPPGAAGFVPQEDLVEMRTDFPETWLWQLEEISGDNSKNLELETPHSITDWILNTICVSNTEGFGMAPETSLRVIKPYFMDFNIPYSVKRGEVLPLKVSLFNYLSHEIPIKLTFGQFTGGDLKSEKTFSACLPSKDNLVHIFKLDANVLGKHNISVTAGLDPDLKKTCGPEISVNMRDGITKPIIVKPEGIPVEKTKSLFVCLEGENESALISWQLEVPQNTVLDSARSEVSVIGDLMGPSLENLDSLVRLPMGCGEQNMVLFVPNIVVLKYLTATNSINPTLRAKALTNMETGYQKELNYRHDDGSYSAFGKSDPSGSMWLTAFVVKSFAQAQKLISIDKQDLKKSTDWILKQQLENGCFRQVGTVFNKAMKGGVADSSAVALSSYIMIALMESGVQLDKKIIENGVYCLTKFDNQTDLYTEILSAYALQLISQRVNTVLTKNAAESSFKTLILKATTGNESEIFWQKEDSSNLGLSIEMTAYAVLTLLKVGGEENSIRAFNAVKWISKQRNAQGGFVSTQDTVVALEALATYASTLPLGDVKMNLKLSTDDTNDLEFYIDEENRQILQEKELARVPNNLHWSATGKGCSLVQSTLRYNIKNSTDKPDAFSMERKLTNIVPNSCSELHLEFNLTYNLADGASNMAVLEVELLSGYEPERSTLDDLKHTLPSFKRWDIEEGKVNLYFDSIEKSTLKVGFVIVQRILVENIKPAQLKLYDYYEMESFVRKDYGVQHLTCK